MKKEEKLKKLDRLKTLCDFDGEKYVSKQGKDYIEALSKLFELKNLNDQPFTENDIINQPVLSDFNFKGVQDFKKICKLKADPLLIIDNKRTNEKIIGFDFESEEAEKIFENKPGVVYIITCEINNKNHIIKIGSTRQQFKGRLSSYNCGVVNNWRTASTTNIKILQSMVSTRKEFTLYLFDCSKYINYTWHDIISEYFATPEYLAFEDILVKEFISQFGKKPLANVQTNATKIN